MKAWRNDKWYNKRVLIWRFTLVLIKINYGNIGGQTGLFNTKNPVFYTSGNRFVRHTGTFGNLWFFHSSHRTTVIQDLLVRCKFSLVPDNCTNVNVEVCEFDRPTPGISYRLIFSYSILESLETPRESRGIEMGPRASSAWRGVRRLCGMYKYTTNPSCGWDVNKTEVPCWEIATLSAR